MNVLQVDIAIRANLADPDENRIPFVVLAFLVALVHKSLYPVIDLDEHAKIGKALDLALVNFSFFDIRKVTT